MPPFEVLLPLGAIGLYLFDSTLLLYSNELLFARRADKWTFATSSALLLAGRRVCFLNPFTPATPQFRVRWSETDNRQERESPAQLDSFLAALRPLRYFVTGLWLLLLALPAELALWGTGIELLALMAAFYSVILGALGYIYWRRRELRVAGKSFLALSFDSLACAPFAVNLVRKLALRRSLAGNPIEFARLTFEPAIFLTLIQTVCRRVSEEQQRESGQTPRWAELETYRKQLLAMTDGPHSPAEGTARAGK
ncbi:MAG: hypothetical protein ACJ8R9_23435 [Steroidobacteraceae bacterium]